MKFMKNIDIKKSTTGTEELRLRLEAKKIDRGLIGSLWGTGENAATNIAGIVALFFSVFCFIAYLQGHFTVVDSMTVLIGSALGFITGRKTK